MQQGKAPCWFPEKLRLLAQTGKLDLSGEAFDDLSFVGSRPSMKQLDLSFTPLKTIEGLMLQPRLDTLIADSSELSNFKNFRAVQKISSISIRNTPVSHLPNFKLSLLIVIGPSLRVINGQYISKKLREKAAQFPPIASDLVNCGWIAEYPCPEEPELDEISKGFGLIEPEEDSFELPNTQVSSNIDFEKTVDYYTNVHKNLIQKAHEQIEFVANDNHSQTSRSTSAANNNNNYNNDSLISGLENDNYDLTLCDKVQIILHHHGYEVDQSNRAESMINILSELLALDDQNAENEEFVENDEKKSPNIQNDEDENSYNDNISDENSLKFSSISPRPKQNFVANSKNTTKSLSISFSNENTEENINISNETPIDEIPEHSEEESKDEYINNYLNNNSISYSSGEDLEYYINKTPQDLKWEQFVAQFKKENK